MFMKIRDKAQSPSLSATCFEEMNSANFAARKASPAGTSGRTFRVDDVSVETEDEVFERQEGQWTAYIWTSRVSDWYLRKIKKDFKIPEDTILSIPENHEMALPPKVS